MTDQNRPQHKTVQHERSDASLRWVIGIIAAVIVFGVIMHYGVLVYFNSYNDHMNKERKSTYPLARNPANPALPPEPRLEQVNRMAGMSQQNDQSFEKLNSYGLSQDKGFVRVPIDRAMAFLADKQPARTEKEIPWVHDAGLVDGGEPNSGQVFYKQAQRKVDATEHSSKEKRTTNKTSEGGKS